MRFVTYIVLFFLTAFGAHAQEVPVTSGAHADFDRIVLGYDAGDNWQFGRVDGGYEFRPDQGSLTFDLSKVYQRIARKRLVDIRQSRNGSLLLEIVCACYAELFSTTDGRVVIDIKDGVAPPTARFENRLDETVAADQKSSDDTTPANTSAINSGLFAPVQSLLPRDDEILFQRPPEPTQTNPTQVVDIATPIPPPEITSANSPLPDFSADNQDSGPAPSEPYRGAGSVHSPAAAELSRDLAETDTGLFGQSSTNLQFPNGIFSDFDPEERDRVNEAQDALVRQIQRAVAQGLLEIAPPDITVPTVESLARKETKEPPQKAADAKLPEPPAEQHVFVETSADRDALDPIAQIVRANAKQNCLPADWFDVAAWGPVDTNALPSLESLRAKLVGEFDRPNSAAILDLAKRFIFLGFGAEANQLLDAFEDQSDQALSLRILGQAVDGQDGLGSAYLDMQINCATPAAMWALITNPSLAGAAEIQEKAIVSAFSTLPLHLRNSLGPLLVNALVNGARPDVAQTIRAAIARSADADASALNLIDAKLEVHENGVEAALPLLETVVAEDGPQAAEALAQLIEDRIQSELPIDQELAASADALAVAYRGTALGERLTKAAIRALSVSGQADTTLLRIEAAQAKGAISPHEAEELRAETFLGVAKNSSDADFVRFVYKYQLDHRSKAAISRKAHISVVERLLELQFVEKAQELLARYEPPLDDNVRVLLAQAELADGNFQGAIDLVVDLNSAQAYRVLAEANENLGRLDLAKDYFHQIDAPDEVQRIAWLQGRWADINENSAPQIQQAAKVAIENRSNLAALLDRARPDQQAPLAAGGELISQSQDLRALLAELLQK